MRRSLLLFPLCVLALVTTGCTMCETAHLCDYGGVGGKWQRGFPACGRVGSNLSDAGATEQVRVFAGDESYGNSWEELDGQPTPVEPLDSDDPKVMLEEAANDGSSLASMRNSDGAIFIGP